MFYSSVMLRVSSGLGRRSVPICVQRRVLIFILPFILSGLGLKRGSPAHFMPERYDKKHAYDINVIEVAADQCQVVFRSINTRVTRDSYNVLRTYWELPNAPEAWRPMLNGIDEIWAPNGFVADAFREIFRGPIDLIPPTVDVGEGPYPARDYYGMDARRFLYFLFSFDYFSSPYRKNPLGVLEAFRIAFPNRRCET